MSTLHFVPLHCEGCDQTLLQPVESGIEAKCPACGAPGSILPGEVYTEADVPVFESLAAMVKAAHLDARSVRRVIAELSRVPAAGGRPELALLQVLDLLPGLHSLLPTLHADPSKLRRMNGMLFVTVSAQLQRIEAENAARAS
ncbi:MAG TPA: hypothetical protein VJN18_34845 [Polyangiaceae bacterium]|nr:hypothetical protein [Polyangiaceae bacterium]